MATNFKYTVNQNGLLTPEQRDFYEENGFLLVKGLISKEECATYTNRFLEIANGGKRAPMLVMKDIALKDRNAVGDRAVTKIQDWQMDDVLMGYCRSPKLLDFVEAIVGGEGIKSMHTMFINKPPDLGQGTSRHPPHQDLWYFPFRPAERTVAAWSAMQHVDEKNGCLGVIPGSHKWNLIKHEYPNDGTVNAIYHGIQGMSSEESAKRLQLVEMDAGDVIFFHPKVVHGSGRNNSTITRKAMCCHFVNCHQSHWFLDPLQDTIKAEVEQIATRKMGPDAKIDWMDVWRYKSRLIRGTDGKLS